MRYIINRSTKIEMHTGKTVKKYARVRNATRVGTTIKRTIISEYRKERISKHHKLNNDEKTLTLKRFASVLRCSTTDTIEGYMIVPEQTFTLEDSTVPYIKVELSTCFAFKDKEFSVSINTMYKDGMQIGINSMELYLDRRCN